MIEVQNNMDTDDFKIGFGGQGPLGIVNISLMPYNLFLNA